MALLSGIPATIITIDSRTREVAEFFDIPRFASSPEHIFTKQEMLALHEQMDYSAFNRNFRSRFGAYERFLSEHNIVSHVNCENRFLDAPGNTDYLDALLERKEAFSAFSQKLDRDRHVLMLLDHIRNLKLALRRR